MKNGRTWFENLSKMAKFFVILGLIIAGIICFFCLGIAALYFTPDEMDYVVNDDGKTCSITGIKNLDDTCLRIPKEIDGYIVTEIAKEAFMEEKMRTVILPDTIKKIGEGAFYNCTNLVRVKGINRCNSLESIEYYAFGLCKKLYKMQLPPNVKNIGDYAFYGLVLWRGASIPSNAEKIGVGAYAGCFFVSKFHIPASVKTIGDIAFGGCKILDKITVDEANPYYSSIDGVLYSKDGKTLISYPTSRENSVFTVPEGVENIDYKSFMLSLHLEEINLPKTIKKIGEEVFITSEDAETKIEVINYAGTVEMWQSVITPKDWGQYSADFIIYCTDGQITKDGTVTYK